MSISGNETESPAETGEQPWFRRMLVGLEYGPTGANDGDDVYMAGITGREIIDNVRRANAEYIIVFMKDHDFAYYNSKAGNKSAEPRRERFTSREYRRSQGDRDCGGSLSPDSV